MLNASKVFLSLLIWIRIGHSFCHNSICTDVKFLDVSVFKTESEPIFGFPHITTHCRTPQLSVTDQRLMTTALVWRRLLSSSYSYKLAILFLQMSSWPGIVIPRWRTSSSCRVGVSKASAFCFIWRTVRSQYPTLNLWRPCISSRCCLALEQSSAAYHICSITSHLLLSLEDILLWTLLPVITVVVPAKWRCHLWTR